MSKYKVSDEKLNTLMTKVFGAGNFWDEDALCLQPVGKDGQALDEKQKILYEALLEIAETHTGAGILNRLDENQRIDLVYNPIQREGVTADCSHEGVVTFYDAGITQSPVNRAGTLLHELTHAVQFQSGWDMYCGSSQDAFMINMVHEAEARAVSAKFVYEMCYSEHKYENTPTNQISPDVRNDIEIMSGLIELFGKDGGSEQSLNAVEFPLPAKLDEIVNVGLMLGIYEDQTWEEFYNKQGLNNIRYKDYGLSINKFKERNFTPMSVLLERTQRRLGFTRQTMNRFMDPLSLPNFPKSEVMGQISQADILENGDKRTVVKEDGAVLSTEVRDKADKLKSFTYDIGRINFEYEFGENERLLKKTIRECGGDGNISKEYVNEYDDKGNVSKEYTKDYIYDDKGNLSKECVNEYDGERNYRGFIRKYDDRGNVCEEYIDECDNKGLGYKLIAKEYKYDDKGNVCEEHIVENDDKGNVSKEITNEYKYDDKGNVSKEICRTRDEVCIDHYEDGKPLCSLTYDLKGNLVKGVLADGKLFEAEDVNKINAVREKIRGVAKDIKEGKVDLSAIVSISTILQQDKLKVFDDMKEENGLVLARFKEKGATFESQNKPSPKAPNMSILVKSLSDKSCR